MIALTGMILFREVDGRRRCETLDAEADGMASSRIIRVLLLKEGTDSSWVAQGLDYDMAAQGESIGEALENFQAVFQGQVALDLQKGREPLTGKKQAPSWYWRALEEAKPLKDPITLKIPRRSWFSFARVTSGEAWVC
jgi:hypothetical protein